MNNAFRVPIRSGSGMPEYQSQTIGPQPGADVSARLDDSAGQIILAQSRRNAEVDAKGWEQFNRGLQTFLHSGNKLYNEYRDKTSRAYVDEALLRAREEMEAWRTSYDQTHQGEAGVHAADDYQKAWSKISEAHLKGLRDKGVSGPYEQLASLHLRENGIHYDSQAVAFQKQQDKAWNTSIFEGKKASLLQEVRNDPDNAVYQGFLMHGVLESYKRLHPGEDYSAFEAELKKQITKERLNTYILSEDYGKARMTLNGASGSGQRGERVAQFESGSEGIRKIGYDGNGGTSYGKYQLSSKQGSYQEWIAHLAKQGGEGAAIAERLKSAGPLNTGSRSGAAVDAYRKEASANSELFERTQREYIENAHYAPMLSKLPAEERAMIEGNEGLQEMAWSVAVQHGGGGGASLLRRAWKPGMSNEDLVDAVYGIRGGYFGSSTKAVQEAVQNRFGEERQLIHSMVQREGKQGAQSMRNMPDLSASEAYYYRNMIKAGEMRQTENQILTLYAGNPQKGLQELSTPEGCARYGLDATQAEKVIKLLQTQWTHQQKVEKQQRENYENRVYTDAVNIAMGAGGKHADPVKAYQMIAEDPILDGESKMKALKALREGTFDKDDPAYVVDIKNRIAKGAVVPDSELARAMAAGQLSSKTKDQILKMRDLTDGPQGEIIKAAFNAMNDAYKKSLMADGTPEQAQAHYAALHELQTTIDQAKANGTVMEILNPSSPKYVLPSIMLRHQLTMRDQADALQKEMKKYLDTGKENGVLKVTPPNAKDRLPNETPREYLKRRNGGK